MTSLTRGIAILLIGLMSSSLLMAQTPSVDWNTIETLKHGAKIIVITRNGREFVGTKRQSTDDTLFIETRFPVQGQRTIAVSRNEIGEVRKKKNRWVLPLIGAAIGFGVGLGIGDSYDRRGGDDPGMGKLLLGPLGGLIGMAAGGLVPMKAKTIYHAP